MAGIEWTTDMVAICGNQPVVGHELPFTTGRFMEGC